MNEFARGSTLTRKLMLLTTFLKCDLKTVKVILKTKKIIQSRLPKTALNNIFFTFLSY